MEDNVKIEIEGQEVLASGDTRISLVAKKPFPNVPTALDHGRTWLIIEKVLTDWIPGIAGSRLIEKIKEDVLNNIK